MLPLLSENKTTLKLALPIMSGQVSQMLLGLADTMMIGRVGTTELAAAAFSNVIFNTPYVIAIGLFIAVSVNAAHAHGGSRHEDAAETLRTGLLLALLTSLVLAGSLFLVMPWLGLFQQPDAVTSLAPPYLMWLALSLIPGVPAMTIKSFCEAKNQPWTVLWIMLGGVALNVFLNYLLIFGNFGLPRLELVGAGLATFLARLATLIALWLYVTRSKRLALCIPKKWLGWLNKKEALSLCKIGSPTAGQLSLEFGAFGITALLIGQFGDIALASHQIAITCAALIFMFPLGIGMAVSIRVGHSIGGSESALCRPITWGGHLSSFVVTGLFAVVLIGFGANIARSFSPDPELVSLASSLLVIVAFFLIFDGAQVVSMSALRGMQDVVIPTVYIFISFWIIGIPAGAVLAFTRSFGARGLWIGLASGLAIASVVLTGRLIHQLRKLNREQASS